MPRNPSFSYRKTPKGWLVNVPGSVSDTGRFRRRYFDTRDKAKDECARLRAIGNGTKAEAVDIPPELAADAIRARDMLKQYEHVTLAQAAAFYIKQHDTRAKTPTLLEAWEDGLKRRANHRARTVSDFKSWKKALPDTFLATNCHDITPKDITKALDATTKGPTRWRTGLRYISAILGDLAKAKTIAENPAAAVHVKRKQEKSDEVTIYTPDELKALFAACEDYPKGEDDRLCADCAVPFAVLAFAGVRPDEITRLSWEDISLELRNIRLGANLTKKATRRNVRINDTLAAWLETVPADKRKGKLVPPRWTYKAAKVRSKAGIDGHEKQDALRHSFGTYTLATENDLDLLKQDMGHEHVRVFFSHYHKALTKAEALPYWQILPPGVEMPTIAAVPSPESKPTTRRKATA